jgi:hypothetical protein
MRKEKRPVYDFQDIPESEIQDWAESTRPDRWMALAAHLVKINDAGHELNADKLRKLARTTQSGMVKRIAQNALTGAEQGNAREATTAAYFALECFFRNTEPYRLGLQMFLDIFRQEVKR